MSQSSHSAWLAGLEASLAGLERAHLLRQLQTVQGAQGPVITLQNKEYLQFCTNNYLGLANDPEVVAAALEATGRLGTGAGASRLVAGSMELHEELERALAAFKGTEAALLFPTGFMANLAVLTTFAGKGDGVVSDKLNHASLLDAAKFSGAVHRTFSHRRYQRAGDLMAKVDKGAKQFLVTDSVFSMDGDLADLPAACDVAAGAALWSSLTRPMGLAYLARGRGVAELQRVEGRIALTIGTLSKALGSVGGFVAGPQAAIDTLINQARSFIYTTALPPATSAASLAALRMVEREPGRRERVMEQAGHVKRSLVEMGFDCGDSASPIVPVVLGTAEAALKAAAFLRERGIWVPAIRPPTVPSNGARLRISLMATHTDGQIEQLLAAMRGLRAA